MKNCDNCKAFLECKSPQMQGEGSEKPVVIFCGEAPGSEEDKAGKPFVGKAGKLLRRALEEMGLPPYRITNAVRCRPPMNKLRGHEIDHCRENLHDELLKYRPKLIVVLGASALKSLMKKGNIMSVRGEVLYWKSPDPDYVPMVLPSIHPASTFYRPENIDYLFQDLSSIQQVLDRKSEDKHEHIYARTKQQVVDIMMNCIQAERIAFDTETNGLNMYDDKTEILCASFAWAEGKAGVIPIQHPESPFVGEDYHWLMRRLETILTCP